MSDLASLKAGAMTCPKCKQEMEVLGAFVPSGYICRKCGYGVGTGAKPDNPPSPDNKGDAAE